MLIKLIIILLFGFSYKDDTVKCQPMFGISKKKYETALLCQTLSMNQKIHFDQNNLHQNITRETFFTSLSFKIRVILLQKIEIKVI